MRRTIATLAVGTLGVVLLTPAAAPARQNDPAVRPAERQALTAGLQTVGKAAAGATAPAGVNPYLALLSDPSKADYAAWRTWLSTKGEQREQRRAQRRAAVTSPLLVDEDEVAGTRGANDTPATGQRVVGFGTGPAENSRARVLGTLSPEQVSPVALEPNAEDDGAIPLARDTGVGATQRGVTTTGNIGDGPHGSTGTATGDFDFYRLTASAGETLTVDITTDSPATLDSVVVLYDAAGTIVAANDDSGGTLDSLLTHQVQTAGTYYAMVGGFGTLPTNPNDPASGTGVGSQGFYNVSIAVGQDDPDFYAVRLRKGDVLGTSVKGAATRIAILDTVPREVMGSSQDASFIYPANTPLPGGGNAVAEHVAEEAGWHYLGVSGPAGGYDITVEVFRPALQGDTPTQTLFLDFDGARLNTAIFGGAGTRTLSPMRSFLARWGLTRADEDALIDAVVARVEENVRQDLIASGLNDRFRLRILNSRDHADPFGQPNVSRVVVGGTVAESGVSTIGIAQSIDPGNFDTEESALVLLDLISDPAGAEYSLNTYLTADSNRVAFVGQALGNVTAHEAGHFFGNFHVDQFNAQANLMDQGGNFPLLYGVGPDNVGGTADDPDVDFGEDVLNPGEGFTGIEDTLSRIVFGVTS